MGRLIRKKPTAKPKRKKINGEITAPSPGGDQDSAKTPVLSVSKPKDNSRKPTGVVSATVAPFRVGFGKENFITKSVQFLREVKIELKKVTWPSRKQALGSTAVVIVLVILISLFLGVVDVTLSSLIRLVVK